MASTKFPTFPNIDFSKLDLSKLNLPKFDFGKLDLPTVDTDAITNAAKDVAYITVGLAVLAYQKAQVRRDELVKALNDQFGSGKAQIESLVQTFETQLSTLDDRIVAIEAKIDTAVAGLEKRLPDTAGALLTQAHDAAKAARKQVRELLTPAA